MNDALARLRVRLTAWYVGVFAAILALFAVALLGVLTRQLRARLDDSLQDATVEITRAMRIRELEGPRGHDGVPVDALDELRIPERRLYVFDAAGRPIHPTSAEPWIRRLAARALADGPVVSTEEAGEVNWRAYARPFTLAGKRYAAAAVADEVEVAQQFGGLLPAFGLAALGALLLVALGGGWLAGKSAEPVERSFAQMRRFMADAAHELRTPVSVLRGRAEVALRQPRDADAYAEVLRRVEVDARRLGGLVENLLTLARADTGDWPRARERVYLDDLLLDAATDARVLGAGKGVRVEVGALEEAPVAGDPALLRQAMMILLDNAVKFTPPGGSVTVSAGRVDGTSRVLVEDTGPGVPGAALPHVFERFYRADAGRSREEGAAGAGLGLSIAEWIARSHGGEVALRPGSAGGTIAALSFPAA